MSHINNSSQVENTMIESSISHIHLSFDQDMFSNYLEPNQNDIFDTRRFSLQPKNLQKINTATPTGPRSTTPGCNRSKMTNHLNSARVVSKSTFRIPSPKPRSQSKLTKKVENLEKKEEMWKERATVWEKERKTYRKALNSVRFMQANPSQFYKSQVETWKANNFLKKVSEDLSNNPLQELKNVFEWILNQPDSVPFKSIKLSFVTIANKLQEIELMLDGPEVNDAMQELNQQNQKLSSHLTEIEQKLLKKSADLEKLEGDFKALQLILDEKDEEIRKICENREEFRRIGESECLDTVIVKLESELEAKNYEVIMTSTENKRLASDLMHSNKSNELYIKTIDELKEKLKNARQEVVSRTEREKENFRILQKTSRLCESATQTGTGLRAPKKKPERKSPGLQDFINFTSCMASAIEALLENRP